MLDGTPLLGVRTGIGRYVAELLPRLVLAARSRLPAARIGVSTWTWRGGTLADLPAGTRQVGRRAPARLLQTVWSWLDHPVVEDLVGDIDIFHGTNFVSPPTRRAREVVTVHDLTYIDLTETVSSASLAYQRLVPRALERGAHVLVPTEVVRDAVMETYGLPASRVTTTPLGVDRAWFSKQAPPREHGLTDLPSRYIVFVGSLDPRKNLPRLIEAHQQAQAVDASVPDLVLAGPAGRETSLQGSPGVHLTGWLSDAALRSVVAGSQGLALPSLDEGFGLPVVETLACGLPVLTSDLPVFSEVAGEFAVTCQPTEIDSIVQALVTLSQTETVPGAAARRRAWASAFTWERCAERTLDAYLRVVS